MNKELLTTGKFATKIGIWLFAMMTLVGCPKPPMPNPEPEPEPEPEPTEQRFKAVTIDQLESAMRIAARKNNTIIIDWADNLATDNQTDNIIGESNDIDDARSDMIINDNGHAIYYPNKNGVPQQISYDEYMRDTDGHKLIAGPDGWHMAISKQDEDKWADAGFTDVIAPEVVATFELTIADAAQMDDYIAEIAKTAAQYPENIVELNFNGITVSEISLETLAYMSTDKISGGNIRVKDSDFKVDKIVSDNMTWGVGRGTSELGNWYNLGRANGVPPTLEYYLDEPQGFYYAAIEIASEPNNIVEKKTLVSVELMPTNVPVAVVIKGREPRIPGSPVWTIDMDNYILVADDELNKKLVQNPFAAYDQAMNSEATRNRLTDMNVRALDNNASIVNTVPCYSATQMKGLTGKSAVMMPTWWNTDSKSSQMAEFLTSAQIGNVQVVR